MENSKNITYLLGAGASYNSCPILKELGEKMLLMARNYLGDDELEFFQRGLGDDDVSKLICNIGYFGMKAIKYGTIDTYAKKLKLNNSIDELDELKLSVSIFFTIWQLTDDIEIKSRNGQYLDDIDRRYISLMASIIENNEIGQNRIKNNIKFVTWNYDLQLELAFKSFCDDYLSWDDLSDYLSYRCNGNSKSNLDICHLNGYSGFYAISNDEQHILDRANSTQLGDLIESVSFVYKSLAHRDINFSNHINYAWETSDLAKAARESAGLIFSQTDILVIIGYSFPSFNKEIDKGLFGSLTNRLKKIIFQDPNASKIFIKQLVRVGFDDIVCINDKIDSFYLPYEF